MNVVDFFNWAKENPEGLAETMGNSCREYGPFEFTEKDCKGCQYYSKETGDCDFRKMADEIRAYYDSQEDDLK